MAMFQFLLEQKARSFRFGGARDYQNEVLRSCLSALFSDLGSTNDQQVAAFQPIITAIAGRRRRLCERVVVTVIVLNGTSSSGKSTLATSLQQQLADECWLVVSNDDFLAKVPMAWLQYGKAHIGEHADQGLSFTFHDGQLIRRVGPVGEQILNAWRGHVAAIAHAGLNVIVDDVVLGELDWQSWCEHLADLDVMWVRVDLALAVVERRERDRGDRVAGLARSQFEVVHRHARYDVRVDTEAMDPDQCAALICAELDERRLPTSIDSILPDTSERPGGSGDQRTPRTNSNSTSSSPS